MNEAKLRQLEAVSTYRMFGHELEFAEGKASAARARRRWRLFSPCFCVHDSPDSPCPCMEDEPRWWVPADAILREGGADRKDHAGQELQYFDVDINATVMVESLQPVKIAALKALGGTAAPQEIQELVSSGSASPLVVYQQSTADRVENEIGKTIEGFVSFWFGSLDIQAAIEEWKRQQAEKRKGRPS
jgi:hypothetical protein